MDEQMISSSVADDTKSESSNSGKGEKELKEKSELIFEIRTICNMDSLVSNCELIENKPLSFSAQEFPKDSDINLISNKNLRDLPYQSELNIKANNLSSIHQSQIATTICEIKNDFSLKQMADFKNSANSLEETISEKSNAVKDLVMVKETNELPSKQLTEYKKGDNLHEKSVQHEQNADSSDCSLLDDSRRSSRRSSKRKKDFDGFCPVCGVTVRLNDLESHYNQEVERLSKISRCSKKMHLEEVPRNEAFDLVRKNRENRLTARVARYSARAKNEVKCPVCSLRMSGTPEEINKHVAFCIQDEDSDVNVDGDDDEGTESFEEYEIGDETRIRPISLVPGGYRSLHGDSVRQTAEDEDLNVDVDDTIAYGDPQYSEIDVIPNTSSEQDRLDLEELRKAVAVDSSARPQHLECHKWSKTEADAENSELSKTSDSLKEKILEDQDRSVRCLICLESYNKPVVSTTCWHVHCEECWLMTMGVKKLCPQCNMIVFPSDLRKIYL